MMFYPYSLTLIRTVAVTATLFALIVILMVPTRAPAMELRIVGNQLILSGPVVGDEPGKVREALASSPGHRHRNPAQLRGWKRASRLSRTVGNSGHAAARV